MSRGCPVQTRLLVLLQDRCQVEVNISGNSSKMLEYISQCLLDRDLMNQCLGLTHLLQDTDY